MIQKYDKMFLGKYDLLFYSQILLDICLYRIPETIKHVMYWDTKKHPFTKILVAIS